MSSEKNTATPSTAILTARSSVSGAYEIHIGAGQTAVALADIAAAVAARRRVFVATSPAVLAAKAEFFKEAQSAGATLWTASCDGEHAKRAAELEALWDALAEAGVDRHGLVVAVGGGVIGDLVGFAAATYLRGVALEQVPTTLLAMVDSSVGGKTGINLATGKNLVGAFWQPQVVRADTDFLRTLPAREFAAGVGEIVKYALLVRRGGGDTGGKLWETLLAAGPLHWRHPALPEIIRECCAIKAEIVSADERETAAQGGRALLNLGHTFGHAIENAAGYGEYLHGEGVAIGTVLAARLSAKLGFFDAAEIPVLENLLRQNALPIALRAPLPLEALENAMQRDKKVRSGIIKFVLLEHQNGAFTKSIDAPAFIREIWQEAGAR
jgi:3-dehydroquinate synthase